MNDFQSDLQNLLHQGIDNNIITRQQAVYAACQVARSVLHLIPEGEDRPRIAIETAEAWCFGSSTLEEVQAAIIALDSTYYTVSSSTEVPYYVVRAVDYAAASAIVNVVNAINYTVACVYYVSFNITTNITESQQQVKQLLLSHLPRLNNLKVWL